MTVKSSATFDVPASVVYRAFLDSSDLSRMTMSQATVEANVDGEWSIFSGSVKGRILELDQDKKIVQSWRFSNWNDKDSSKVVLTFKAISPACTTISVEQTGIPTHDRFGNPEQETLCQRGWEDKYWTGMAKILGYPRNKD